MGESYRVITVMIIIMTFNNSPVIIRMMTIIMIITLKQ